METVDSRAVETYLRDLQQNICDALEAIEGEGSARFVRDAWEKPADSPLQGRGETRVLSDGKVFERAGVAFSDVRGTRLPPSATQNRPELAGRGYRAMGVSLVFHPRNPYVPTVHANVRFFVAEVPPQSGGRDGRDAVPVLDRGAGSRSDQAHALPVWWFGGGFDLTPYYGFDEDVQHWHATAKAACDGFVTGDGAPAYPKLKQWCDEYFFLKHRNEPRGVGGLFFDDWHVGGFAQSFALQRSVGDHFLKAYLPIVERRKDMAYGERERNWQLYRRGRYVEFNLVWDRGTHFGLQSGGRTESILMSMPPLAAWQYDYQPEAGTPEAELLSKYLVPREW